MRQRLVSIFLGCGLGVAAIACNDTSRANGTEDDFTSNSGHTLEFRLTGEVVAASNDTPRHAITTQLQYLQGQLSAKADVIT